MKKNAWVILAALSTLLILTGCSSNSSEHKSSASSKAELVKSSSSKKKHSEKKKESSSEKESSSSSLSSEVSSSSSTQSSEDLGEDRGGYVTTPEAMRGTWYSKSEYGMKKLVISEHEIAYTDSNGQSGRTILYKKTIPTPDNVSEEEVKDKMEWGDARYVNIHGLQYINVLGWFQTAGAGADYAAHTEEINGNKVPVVVEGGGAGYWTFSVYYPSEDLANQQGDTKYEDLYYQ